ncbi:MAG: mechanosensitive ion channel family protein [Lysobacter sp.]
MDTVAGNWLNSTLPAWLDAVARPALGWQAGVVLVCLVVAWLAQRHFGGWVRRRLETDVRPRWRAALVGSGRHLAFPLVLCATLLLGWGVFGALRLPRAMLWLTLSLAAAFGLVRLAFYLLERAMKPGPLLRASENFIVVIVWIGLALYLLDWLPLVVDALDRAAITVGKARISALAVLNAVLVGLVVMVLALWLARLVERTVMASEQLSASLRIGISKTVKLVLLVLAGVVVLQIAGVNLSALAVVGGTVGLGIGLGLQRIVSNFLSGFILLAERSVKPGDVITVEDQSGSRYGWVHELRARYIVIRDRDGVDTLVPNENLIINPVINWSYGGNSIRLKLPVRISYDDDPEQGMALLVQSAAGHQRVLDDPEPAARLMAFGSDGIELELRVWITNPEQGVNNVRSEINLAIWRAFKRHGLTMPFPQREVRIIRADAPPTQDAGAPSVP